MQVHAAKGHCVMRAYFLHVKRPNCVVRQGFLNCGAGFAKRLLRHINETWPGDHRIENAALDGTGVAHAAQCVVSQMLKWTW